MLDTVSDSIQNTGKEPFRFLTYELGVIHCCIDTSTLEFAIWQGKDISSFLISQRNMDMTKSWIGKKLETIWKTDGLTHCSQEATTISVF